MILSPSLLFTLLTLLSLSPYSPPPFSFPPHSLFPPSSLPSPSILPPPSPSLLTPSSLPPPSLPSPSPLSFPSPLLHPLPPINPLPSLPLLPPSIVQPFDEYCITKKELHDLLKRHHKTAIELEKAKEEKLRSVCTFSCPHLHLMMFVPLARIFEQTPGDPGF